MSGRQPSRRAPIKRHLQVWDEFAATETAEPLRQLTRDALSRQRGVGDVVAAAAGAAALAESTIAAARARFPPEKTIACRQGCSYCCHLKVIVNAAEVLRIVDHLKRHLTEDELRTVRDRVAVAERATRGMSHKERGEHQTPCPLLDGNRCSVHPVRPLACVGHNAFDVRDCEAGYNHTSPIETYQIESYAVQHSIANTVQAGMGVMLAQNGLDGSRLELNAALKIALERENAAERYVQGRHVFAAARDADATASLPPDVARRLRGG